MMNSWLRLPPIGPVSARIGIARRPMPREGAQIGGEHAGYRRARAFAVEVEGIGVLHQELARAHGAEARTDLVAELPAGCGRG